MDAFEQLYQKIDFPERFIGKSTDGKTDSWISKEILHKIKQNYTKTDLEEINNLIITKYLNKSNEIPNLVPGVHDLFKQILKMKDVSIGIASGNFPTIGWKKLEITNLLQYFPNLISGMGYFDTRIECLLDAKKNAQKQSSKQFKRFVHIGDTINDVESAKAVNFTPILVKTGRAIPESIISTLHCTVVENFEEGIDKILQTIAE
ncbi:hypothetical protein TVAG_319760 [Trichomonas vaginalis G3]|uniref:Haloacid dehalogenase-like hydrolase family protein n=1 Tax=Trichomonas vaginalis (strain ATCC PRA-98 / G3) TaxID=412133 RepID=A2DQC4_TRIV3|nr:HAD-hyrolase-like family [Trichomonas vaginalis G3]EAY17381.1 hypothetical protein TVAG_319760 [Trichomonas vaginalis G3]KAI5491391.1 HAD-hyrolase-like family [Trichomonas vaginalis G3]|eukprot:XP_001330750.1 hypothetical protein [Trichomonas vaginalis G3]